MVPAVDGDIQRNLHQHAAVQLLLHQFLDDAGNTQANLGKLNQAGPWWSLPESDGKDVVFRHVFVHMVAGQSLLLVSRSIIFPVSNGLVSCPSLRYRFSDSWGGDKGVLDIHDRDKGQVITAHRRLGNQAQVDLLLFQPGWGLGRGLVSLW